MFEKHQKRDKTVQILCSTDELIFLKREAKKKKMYVSDMIRELLNEKFNKK